MSKDNNKPVQSTFKMEGNWNRQSRILKDKFLQLTDADLKFEEGKENELIDRISQRINKGRDEVINIIRKGQPTIG